MFDLLAAELAPAQVERLARLIDHVRSAAYAEGSSAGYGEGHTAGSIAQGESQ